jgi:hypothetical protein
VIPFDADVPFDSATFTFDGDYAVMPVEGWAVRGSPSHPVVRGGATGPVLRGLPSSPIIRGEDS